LDLLAGSKTRELIVEMEPGMRGEGEGRPGAEPGLEHLLGEYDIPDARRLLAALERHSIIFELEKNDEIRTAWIRGSFGQTTKLKVWISERDRERAERIQQEEFEILT